MSDAENTRSCPRCRGKGRIPSTSRGKGRGSRPEDHKIDYDEAVRLYTLCDMSLKEVAKELDCDKETVRQALIYKKVRLRRPGERTTR